MIVKIYNKKNRRKKQFNSFSTFEKVEQNNQKILKKFSKKILKGVLLYFFKSRKN
jgi:hypothetical protein